VRPVNEWEFIHSITGKNGVPFHAQLPPHRKGLKPSCGGVEALLNNIQSKKTEKTSLEAENLEFSQGLVYGTPLGNIGVIHLPFIPFL